MISTTVNGTQRKLLQLMFSRSDGSVFVSFPYYEHEAGIVAAVTLAAGASQVDLAASGSTTSHLVKYAHHPDGEAHFSQDGKVLTTIRRKAMALSAVDGHLFTAHLTGYEAFRSASEGELTRAPTTKRAAINFDVGHPAPAAIKIVGRLYKAQSIRGQGQVPTTPEPVLVESHSSSSRWAMPVSAPEDRPGSELVVLLTCEEWVADKHPVGPSLQFIGAFDPPAITRDATKPTSFLALSYPVDSADELRERIGTIDFRASPDQHERDSRV